MRDQIIDAAEARIRAAGFHGFSFREIATDVGIKSSSVHYHFPTKTDLAVATATRYRERFMEALGAPDDARTSDEKVAAVTAAFRHAMTHDGLMCLCGTLGAEHMSLPEPVGASARAFFVELNQWLATALAGDEDADVRSMRVLATLEGALLVARTLDDVGAFDKATASL